MLVRGSVLMSLGSSVRAKSVTASSTDNTSGSALSTLRTKNLSSKSRESD